MIREAIVYLQSPLTCNGDGTVQELEDILKPYYEKWKCDPSEVVVDDLKAFTRACGVPTEPLELSRYLNKNFYDQPLVMQQIATNPLITKYRSKWTGHCIKISERIQRS